MKAQAHHPTPETSPESFIPQALLSPSSGTSLRNARADPHPVFPLEEALQAFLRGLEAKNRSAATRLAYSTDYGNSSRSYARPTASPPSSIELKGSTLSSSSHILLVLG